MRAADSDPKRPRWARVPHGKTCAWCLMLASRGWVYLDARSAGAARQWHADCDCQIVPAWGDKIPRIVGYDPDALYAQYVRLQKAMLTGDFDEETARFKEDVDYALSLARTSQWFTVDRMAPLHETFGVKSPAEILGITGDIIQHKPYIATSVKSGGEVSDNSPRVWVRILVPENVHYAPLWLHSDYPEEKEILLAGGNLEVVELGKEKDEHIVYLKYHPMSRK